MSDVYDHGQLDDANWPQLDLDALAPLDQWRAFSALSAAGVARTASTSTSAWLSLWRRGKRTDDQMAARTPALVYAPPWVADMARAPGGLAALLDPALVLAAETAAALSADSVEAHVAVRALLAGEPRPEDGGWRAPGAQGGGHGAEEDGAG